MESLFQDIVKGQLDIAEQDKEHFVWHSFWFLICKADRVVGAADFKGQPNGHGEVEIGYGLGKEFEHKGYMTEAVKAMYAWALEQDNVQHVLAETSMHGLASQHVLQQCGFKEYKRNETIWWRL